MKYEEFVDLLGHGESDWLDYKAELHAGIEHHKKSSHPELWEAGKATLLKDLMCLANSPTPRRIRYLVRGVKDLHGKRTPVGAVRSMDDADIQEWARDRFDPPLEFLYTQWSLESGRYIGVFQVISSALGPVVPGQNLGKVVATGQVWWRTGSGNAIAGRTGLARLFGPPSPAPVVCWQLSDGTLSQTAQKTPLSHYMASIDRAFPDKLQASLAALKAAATAFDPEAEWTPRHNPLSGALTEHLVQFSDTKVIELQRDLQNWGFEAPEDLLKPQAVYTDRSISWARPQDVLLTVDGPGLAWYKSLSNLLETFEERQREQRQAQDWALLIRIPTQLLNQGRGELPETTIRFITLENVRFLSPKVGTLQRISSWVNPRPAHEPGWQDLRAERLPPGGSVPLSFLSLIRQDHQKRSRLRYEITGHGLAEAIHGELIVH